MIDGSTLIPALSMAITEEKEKGQSGRGTSGLLNSSLDSPKGEALASEVSVNNLGSLYGTIRPTTQIAST